MMLCFRRVTESDVTFKQEKTHTHTQMLQRAKILTKQCILLNLLSVLKLFLNYISLINKKKKQVYNNTLKIMKFISAP